MKIKASVRISLNGYGFGHDWTLVLIKDGMPRTFMLGQDVKYCSRVGLEPASIVAALGSNDLKDPKINEQLAGSSSRIYLMKIRKRLLKKSMTISNRGNCHVNKN